MTEDEPYEATDAEPSADPGAAEVDPEVDAELEDDLWGPAEDGEPKVPVSRSAIIVAVAVVVVGLIAFLALSGGGGDDDKDAKGSTDEVSATTPDGKPQLTSEQAPWGAKILVPSTLPPGATPTGCGTWDAAFNNPPAEVADGIYIWSDFDGWHLQVAGTNPATVTGSVAGTVTPVLQSEPSPGVDVKSDDAAKRLTFTITGGEEPVGFDFSAGCKQKELTFDLTSGGTAVTTDRIHLGSKGIVEEYPLVARRTLPKPG